MNDRRHRAAAWVYQGVWRGLVRWFRVPDSPPALPLGSAEHVQTFRPSDGYLRYLKLMFWVVLLVTDAVLTALWIALAVAWPLIGLLVAPLAIAIIVLPDIVAYVAIHLKYDTTWYVISDRSLRIRRGIWTIHETTLTYGNIQNVKVVQGPLERYFGIANVIVETAGGGGGGEGHQHGGSMGAHKGLIAGVDNAAAIRHLIMSRAAISGDAGLGDSDDVEPVERNVWTEQHVRVLGEIAALLRMRVADVGSARTR